MVAHSEEPREESWVDNSVGSRVREKGRTRVGPMDSWKGEKKGNKSVE
jgi:hypothetical protein